MNVTASQGLLDGIPSSSTEDGWSVSYDKVLVSIGRASLEGDRCNDYSGFGYDRIVEMKIPGPQKLSLHYALGQCEFGFGIGSPDTESVLGAGVTDEDRALMLPPAQDRFERAGGPSVFVQGSANRDGRTKTFTWSFSLRIRYRDCSDGAMAHGFVLEGHQSETANIEIAGETLLQDNLDASRAKLRFNAFADADSRYGNDDGEITLEELGRVPLVDIQETTSYRDLPPSSDAWKTLEDYVYAGLVPRMPRFQTQGSCTMTTKDNPGERDQSTQMN